MEQGVVEGLATILGSLYEYLEILHHLLLSAEVAESQWAQGILKVFLALREPFFAYVKIFVYHIPYYILSDATTEATSREAASATTPRGVTTMTRGTGLAGCLVGYGP